MSCTTLPPSLQAGVDYFALSFVRDAAVIYELKAFLAKEGGVALLLPLRLLGVQCCIGCAAPPLLCPTLVCPAPPAAHSRSPPRPPAPPAPPPRRRPVWHLGHRRAGQD